LIKKSSKKEKLIKKAHFNDKRTRNPQGAIYNTGENEPYYMSNEPYLKMKSTDRTKIQRVKKKRSSASNSHSKSK